MCQIGDILLDEDDPKVTEMKERMRKNVVKRKAPRGELWIKMHDAARKSIETVLLYATITLHLSFLWLLLYDCNLHFVGSAFVAVSL